MLYITGDIHGDPRRLSSAVFPQGKRLTREDTVVILGDFTVIWNYHGISSEERYWLNWLENKPWTTVFVDGNHENFDRLYQYPIKEWNGGKVHEIRPHVLHLMRGEIFTIDGYKCLAFGGAQSHDIKDGILDAEKDKLKIKAWRKDLFKLFRVNKQTWWEQEMPTESEMNYCIEQLRKHDFKVDFIFSHDCPSSTQYLLGKGWYKPNSLNIFFEEVRANTTYKRWYFGHYHEDRAINDKDILMCEKIIQII